MNFIASVSAELESVQGMGKGQSTIEEESKNCFVRLHRDDNVLVCCRAVNRGARVNAYGRSLTVDADIHVGHKIAFEEILQGDKVKKYGVSIGSMTKHVKPGAHVHVHNLKSDYIPSHTRDDAVRD